MKMVSKMMIKFKSYITQNEKGPGSPMLTPSTSTDKGDKKEKHVTSR